MKTSTALGLAAGAAAAAGAGYVAYNALEGADPVVHFEIEAEPRVIDEGERVEFTIPEERFVDPETGAQLEPVDVPPIPDWEWDFDDGTKGSSKGNSTRHRFADNRLGGYEVSAKLFNSRNWVKVEVNNVAPEIRGVWHSRPTIEKTDIEFEGLAVDPGINDELTFSWDFGDGETGTGRKVKHAYEAKGTYQVTLKVDDGDLGVDEWTETVIVGEGGSFTVSGDVSTGLIEADQIVLAGSTENPLAKTTQEPCALRFQLGSTANEATIALTANLQPGLGQRNYSVGQTTEWDGSWDARRGSDEFLNPGTFFASAGLPPRTIRGMPVGGAFWSRGGGVSVDYFDGEYVELSFNTHLVENIPATFGPRQVQVTGVLAQKLDRSVGGVFEGIGTVFGSIGSAMEQWAPGEEPTADPANINFYLCDIDDTKTFDIESKTPVQEAVNSKFVNPEIEVRFTKAVKQPTIADNMHLVVRGSSGHHQEVPGTWQPTPGDNHAVTFTPQSNLHQGAIYCVGVQVGEDGVRGQDDEILEPGDTSPFSDDTRDACQASGTGIGYRMWAFSTRPELTNAKVDVYQASVAGDGTPLVPRKPTVSRVYASWDPPGEVAPAAQVKRIPALVTVLANGSPVYAPRRAQLKRPDLFTDSDERNANNSTNFYNWRPGGSGSMSLRAKIELLDENQQPVEEFESPEVDLDGWDRSPELRFDYYMVKVAGDCATQCQNSLEDDPCADDNLMESCDWTEGIGLDWIPKVRTIVLEGAQFTTQNFPVVETQARGSGSLEISVWSRWPCSDRYPGNPEDCVTVVGPPWVGTRHLEVDDYVAEQLLEAAQESGTDANIVVGFVPPGILRGQGSWAKGIHFENHRVILVEAVDNRVSTLTHEFGHFYGLDHCPTSLGSDDPCPPPLPQIQGFRVVPSGASGFNKHAEEGNQESEYLTPLMGAGDLPPFFPAHRVRFIKKADYRALFDAIASNDATPYADLMEQPQDGVPLLASLLPQAALAQTAGTSLTVSGQVIDGEIRLSRVLLEPSPSELVPPNPGSYSLELLDRNGNAMQAISFEVTAPDRWHGEPDDPSYFRLQVPAPIGLHAVRVRGPAGAEATRERSPAAPIVEAESTTSPDGTRTLTWSAIDADGDHVVADVLVRADEGQWRGVAIDTPSTGLTLEPWELPAGERISARIVVSDGFNTASTEIDIGPGAPISILTTIPADGATDVETSLDVVAWVSNPMLETEKLVVRLPSGSFTLVDPEGEEVFADVAYQPGTGVVTLTPVEPLRPETLYTATMEGLEDLWGNQLAEPVSWSFTTRPAN